MPLFSPRKSFTQPTSEVVFPVSKSRKKQSAKVFYNDRDELALTWIGQQYGICLDHLQFLLGELPGFGAQYDEWISEGAARAVVTRWKNAGWVQASCLRVKEPFWVWLTHRGLSKVGLPYGDLDLTLSDMVHLRHWYAINAIRLHVADGEENIKWISERQLVHGVVHRKGKRLLHRPDAEMHYTDGDIIAIEAELSSKKPFMLAEILMELLHGKEYLRLKAEYGWKSAREKSYESRSKYTQVWYFAPPPVRQLIYRVRAKFIKRGYLSEQDAERLVVHWYPLAQTDEEVEQEERENRQARLDPTLLADGDDSLIDDEDDSL